MIWNDDLDISADGIYEKGLPCDPPDNTGVCKQRLLEELVKGRKSAKLSQKQLDKDMVPILDVGEWKHYCLAIGDDETRLKLCKLCDAGHAEDAERKKDILIYTCHAGIAEAVAPIHECGMPVGYLMIGNFRDTDQKLSSPQLIKEKAAEFGLDKKYLLKCWKELPLVDSKQMQDALLLLRLISNEIINEQLIHAAKTNWTERVTEYIGEHLGDNITVEDLCSLTKMKRHELYAQFKQYFNASPRAYIDGLRLSKARELLISTDMPIKNISETLGFSKVDAFSKFFREKTGTDVTPLQYRKQKHLQSN